MDEVEYSKTDILLVSKYTSKTMKQQAKKWEGQIWHKLPAKFSFPKYTENFYKQ